jgi:type II secretory pathway component GspD/PulD (secretin)
VLSSPKVATINNKEAKILLGEKYPYTTQTVNSNGTTQETKFLDVGIKLTVTPTINADKKISLQVHPEVSLFSSLTAAGPRIATREALTTVIVSNGETAVIGGLITDNDQNLAASVPLMGELPIIGHFFKHTTKSKERTELLVFITPQIVN